MSDNPYSSPLQPSPVVSGPQPVAGEVPEGYCPYCGLASDNIKVFEVLEKAKFFWFFFSLRSRIYAACPRCMRQIVWHRCRSNILSANLLWPIYVLPRAIICDLLTRRGPKRKPKQRRVD